MSDTEEHVLSLDFCDTDQRDTTGMPSAHHVATVGAWMAERCQYRVAQQLMGLACAIAEVEADQALSHEIAHVPTLAQRTTGHPKTVSVPLIGHTRTEHPRTDTRAVRPTAWAYGEGGDVIDVSAFSDPPLQPGYAPIHVACKMRHTPGTACGDETQITPIYKEASDQLGDTQVIGDGECGPVPRGLD
jgi:hypothetical protein